jgi:hypothetical protein
MTKVLVRPHCCLPAPASLQSLYAEEDLLDNLYGARPAHLSVADLVGLSRNRSHRFHVLVGCLSQRLVLRLRQFQDWVIVKLPPASVHPVPPLNVQLPVIVALVNTV